MYGRILRNLRESKGRSQVDIARAVGISPAHLARLESSQRGLYLEDFVKIAEALGEKPGNLLPNELGDIGYLKPLIDSLVALRREVLPHVTAIVSELVLMQDSASPAPAAPQPRLRAKRVRN